MTYLKTNQILFRKNYIPIYHFTLSGSLYKEEKLRTMDSLREYLREKNLLFSMDDIENSIDKESLMNRVEEAKIKYRKSYLKKKKQEYRKSKHRVEFSLSKEGKSSEYDLVKKRAKNKKLGVFMKECALAYLQNEYVIPNDDLINNCIKEIAAYREDRNKEGRNIKHIVDKANRRGYTIPEDLEDLKQRLYKLNNLEYTFSLEDKIEQLLRYPEEELLDFLRRKFEDNPSLVSQVGELVQTFKM